MNFNSVLEELNKLYESNKVKKVAFMDFTGSASAFEAAYKKQLKKDGFNGDVRITDDSFMKDVLAAVNAGYDVTLYTSDDDYKVNCKELAGKKNFSAVKVTESIENVLEELDKLYEELNSEKVLNEDTTLKDLYVVYAHDYEQDVFDHSTVYAVTEDKAAACEAWFSAKDKRGSDEELFLSIFFDLNEAEYNRLGSFAGKSIVDDDVFFMDRLIKQGRFDCLDAYLVQKELSEESPEVLDEAADEEELEFTAEPAAPVEDEEEMEEGEAEEAPVEVESEEEIPEEDVDTVEDFVKSFDEYDGELKLEFKPIMIDGKEYQVTGIMWDDAEEGKLVASVVIDMPEEAPVEEEIPVEAEEIFEEEVPVEGEEELE